MMENIRKNLEEQNRRLLLGTRQTHIKQIELQTDRAVKAFQQASEMHANRDLVTKSRDKKRVQSSVESVKFMFELNRFDY